MGGDQYDELIFPLYSIIFRPNNKHPYIPSTEKKDEAKYTVSLKGSSIER